MRRAYIPAAVLMFSSLWTIARGAPATRQVCTSPPGGQPGARVSAPVSVDNAEFVAGIQVDLRYPPELLTFVAARLGARTAAAGGWSAAGAVLGDGLVRVLANSNTGVALGPGPGDLLLVDFDITSAQAVAGVPLPLEKCVLGDASGLPIACEFCVQPGVDAAAVRFLEVLVNDGLSFTPPVKNVEPGDWIVWRHAGATLAHSTTSGASCQPDGLWDADLIPARRFSRRFVEPPGPIPYFCRPHCAAGMIGIVQVTDPISLTLAPDPAGTLLTWMGGAGPYRLFRCAHPAFAISPVQQLTPSGGSTGTSFVDGMVPAAGSVLYYLVLND